MALLRECNATSGMTHSRTKLMNRGTGRAPPVRAGVESDNNMGADHGPHPLMRPDSGTPLIAGSRLTESVRRCNFRQMGTLAVVSRKGGSGKSTLATNLAAYLARRTDSITLGDLDHQQSMRVWLSRRPSAAPRIIGWVGDSMGLARPAFGTQHLVLDTPGGLHGLGLARVVMAADAILVPVGGSVFDRESASDCWNELRGHPRVVNGKCRVVAVGMRMDTRTAAEQVTEEWAASVNIPYVTSLRMAQIYVRAVENGISIFDLPEKLCQVDRKQWEPVLAWAEPVFFPASVDPGVAKKGSGSDKVVLLRPLDSRPMGAGESRFPAQDVAHVEKRSGLLSRLLPGFLSRRG